MNQVGRVAVFVVLAIAFAVLVLVVMSLVPVWP